MLDARAVLGNLYMGGAGAASRPLGQASLRPKKTAVCNETGAGKASRTMLFRESKLLEITITAARGCKQSGGRKSMYQIQATVAMEQ